MFCLVLNWVIGLCFHNCWCFRVIRVVWIWVLCSMCDLQILLFSLLLVFSVTYGEHKSLIWFLSSIFCTLCFSRNYFTYHIEFMNVKKVSCNIPFSLILLLMFVESITIFLLSFLILVICVFSLVPHQSVYKFNFFIFSKKLPVGSIAFVQGLANLFFKGPDC